MGVKRTMSRWPVAWISALSSALLGIIVGTASDVVFRGSSAENLTNGLVGAALGIVLGQLLENTRIDSDAGKVSDLLRHPEMARLIEDAHRARNFVERLNKGKDIQRFYQDRLTELCSSTDWSELAHGQLTIDPHRELSFNKDALSICSRHLRAVSYQDEAFWALPEGRAFIEANHELLQRGRQITRIFVFDHEIGPDDVKQMTRQQDLGIQVRVLPPASLSEEDRLDFVLYDEHAVRVAQQPSRDGRKGAMLNVAEREVQHYIERFKNLQERSLRLGDFEKAAP